MRSRSPELSGRLTSSVRTRHRHAAISFLVFVSMLHAIAAPALAQEGGSHDEEARVLFQAAQMAFGDGRYEDALGYFERSYELSGRPALLFNIGTTADRLRLEERALEAFGAYLEALPEASNRREVEARIRILERSIAERSARPSEEASGPATLPSEEGGAAEASSSEGPEAEPSTVALDLSPTSDVPGDEKKKLVQKGWFWAVIGVAAVAVGLGVTAAGISVASSKNKSLDTGDDGSVIYTLSFGR